MRLKIVGLPIGNIRDLSARAITTLEDTKFIVCEDSRVFSNLWSKLSNEGIVGKKFEGKIKFVNDFNEYRVLPKLLDEMDLLEEAVLVSDAGMPLISDPGYKLVHEGIKRGWEIDVVPGPTAESAALAISGLPTDKFMFLGFLPKKDGKRSELLTNIKKMNETVKFTVVIYESTARLEKVLSEMKDIFGGNAQICLTLDITKVSQKIFRSDLEQMLTYVKGKNIKGEATLVVSLP